MKPSPRNKPHGRPIVSDGTSAPPQASSPKFEAASPREMAAARQRRARARRRNDLAVFKVVVDPIKVIGDLIDAGLLSEEEALRHANVEDALSRAIALFFD